MALVTRQTYRFGDFSLDATAKVLVRNGRPVKLTRKAVETLAAMLEHPDQVLTKEELIESIWRGRVVDEANLIQNIAVVRKALQIPAGQPGYIETFPARGYRLVGPILLEEGELHGPEHKLSGPALSSVPLESSVIPAVAAAPNAHRKHRTLAWTAGATVLLCVAAVLFLRGVRRAPEGYGQNFRRTAVARLGGKEFQPGISPDGASVAFTIDREDGKPPQIWVKRAEQNRPFMLGKEGWSYSSPVLSSDGNRIAFLRFGEDRGELVVAAIDGSNEGVITHLLKSRFGLQQRHLDWSPDGKRFAVDDTSDPEQPFAIYLVSPGGERKRLTRPPAYAIGDVDPRFSPDGKKVSFVRVFHRARQGLFVLNLETMAMRALSDQTFQISGQDWTNDGRNIVFAWNKTGEFRLWRTRTDKPQSSPVLDWTGVYGDAPIELGIARKSGTVVYSILQSGFDIWRLDVKAPLANGAWKRIINSSAQDASPQYSPDGSQICFRSDRTGDDQLFVSAADGSGVQQITRGDLRPSVGRWSPDGRAIVFNDSREGDLYIATRHDDSSWRTGPIHSKGTHPVFSADGEYLYAGRVNKILRIPVSGGETTVLSETDGLSFGLSPNGKLLYFVRSVTGESLWQLELESGKISKVLDGLVPYCTSCWAAAPSGIYYLRSTGSVNGQAVYFHAFAGAAERLVAEYPEPLLPLGSGPFSLSPDGRYLLCVRVDSSNSDVMRIDPQN